MLALLDDLTAVLADAAASPWLWLVVFAVAGLDALLPFMPSETTVITVAVLLGPHPGPLATLVVVATLGAAAGDTLGYCIGRFAGPPVLARVQRGAAGRRRYRWARRVVADRATLLILAARYIPGGRVATALATGSLGFPIRRFVLLDLLGAGIWATYSATIGWLGGAAFADRPSYGLLLAFGVGLILVGMLEVGRRVLAHSGVLGLDDAIERREPAPASRQR